MDDADVMQYLDRIGIDRPARADADSLRDLQAAHLDAIPFENLSVHLGEPISLDETSLLDKVVGRRRGGFCYELNGGFAMLLRALGFDVELLAGRVMLFDRFGPPLDHLALRVRTPEPWLVDVGFGAHSRYPLRLDETAAQEDPYGTFEVVAAPHGDLDVMKNGKPQYRLELRPRDLDEFAAMCWYQQNSPAAMFTQSLVCTRPTQAGRVTLSGRLLIRTEDGRRTETTLDTDDDVLNAYRDSFGLELTEVPVLRAT
jgi:N-hydroxyarylamine O-acetyltransferase